MTRRAALRGLAVAAAVALLAFPHATPHHSRVSVATVLLPVYDRPAMVDLDEQRASRTRAALVEEVTTTTTEAPPVTTTTTVRPAPKVAPPTTAVAAPPPPPPAPTSGLNWPALRRCENGGSYVSKPTDYYRGAYQFDRGTWNGVLQRMADAWDGDGENPWSPWVGVDPAAAPPEVQDAAALHLFGESGRHPWPVCGRYL